MATHHFVDVGGEHVFELEASVGSGHFDAEQDQERQVPELLQHLGIDLTLDRKVAVKEYMPQGIAGRAPGTTAVYVYMNQDDYKWGSSACDNFNLAPMSQSHRQETDLILSFIGTGSGGGGRVRR